MGTGDGGKKAGSDGSRVDAEPVAARIADRTHPAMTHFEERQKGFALISDCCRLPFGYIKDGKLVLIMLHAKKAHEMTMTANDLRSIANLLDWMNGIRPA